MTYKTTHSLTHSFDVKIAAKYKDAMLAIMIHHLQYWIMHNKILNRNQNEDRTWMYNTLEEFAAHFEYLSKDQVKRLLNKAVRLGIIRKGNFNESKMDRTVWYAFENEEEFLNGENQ